MLKNIVITLIAAQMFVNYCTASTEDSIEKELSKAKEEYKEAIAKARTSLLEAFNQKIKDVASLGDLDEVKSMQMEKAAFESTGKLPKSKRMAKANQECVDAVKSAKTQMNLAFDKATREYTKVLDITNAEAIRSEAEKFKSKPTFEQPEDKSVIKEAPPKDPRTFWISKNGQRRFELIAGKNWKEEDTNGNLKMFYVEVERNADFIELLRSDSVRIRLHNNVFYWDGNRKEGVHIWREALESDISKGAWRPAPKTSNDEFQLGTVWTGLVFWKGDKNRQIYTFVVTERTNTKVKGFIKYGLPPEEKQDKGGMHNFEGEITENNHLSIRLDVGAEIVGTIIRDSFNFEMKSGGSSGSGEARLIK